MEFLLKRKGVLPDERRTGLQKASRFAQRHVEKVFGFSCRETTFKSSREASRACYLRLKKRGEGQNRRVLFLFFSLRLSSKNKKRQNFFFFLSFLSSFFLFFRISPLDVLDVSAISFCAQLCMI